jgi:hypothetical protein
VKALALLDFLGKGGKGWCQANFVAVQRIVADWLKERKYLRAITWPDSDLSI